MAKKTSTLKLKVKGPDLVNYSIWWVHHGDLKSLASADQVAHYVVDEINDLLWEDSYKRTSLSVPDFLGVDVLGSEALKQLEPARRLATGHYTNFVGILVHHRDVNAFMHGNGIVTNYLGERQINKGKTLEQRLAQFDHDVKALTIPLSDFAETRDVTSSAKPLGARVADLESTVHRLTSQVKDLSQYQIWWMDYDTLEGFGTWPPNKLIEEGKLPPYIYTEVYSLLDNDRYLETGLSISPELDVTSDDWKEHNQVIGQNMFQHGLVSLVGILVRKDDVTDFMRGIGRFTDHMAVPLVTGKEKYFNIRDYAVWWLTYGELELLADEVEGESTVAEDYVPGLTKFSSMAPDYLQKEIILLMDDNPYLPGEVLVPMGLNFTIEDCDREAGYVNPMNPTLEERYGVVIKRSDMLPMMEEMGLVTDHTFCRMTDPAAAIHRRLVKAASEPQVELPVAAPAVYCIWWLTRSQLTTLGYRLKEKDTDLKIPGYLETEILRSAKAWNHAPSGGITIPSTLPMSLMAFADNGSVIDIENRGLDKMQGFVFDSKDWHDHMDELGIITDTSGHRLFRPDSKHAWKLREERQLTPFVNPPSDDIERDCNDALETFCIWWLGQDENKRINEDIRKGKVKLPGYIADELRRYEDCITTGKVSVFPSFPSEVKEIIDESDSEDNIDVNGIVLMNVDAYAVEKLGGCLTTLDMKSFAVETHLAEELAIHKRPYTEDEIREMFLERIRGLIDYWGGIHPTNGKEAASGMAHSICATIAGCSMDLPGFMLVPMGNAEDNAYLAENGSRPWPVVPDEVVETLTDAGGYLNEMLYHPAEKPVAQCEFWLTKDQWRQGMAANKWAWCFEVLLKDTQFIKDRYVTEHPGVVLGNAYRELCRVCLKHGAYFVPDEWDVLDDNYSFKWVTDDPDVFEAMLNEMSGYTLRGHF